MEAAALVRLEGGSTREEEDMEEEAEEDESDEVPLLEAGSGGEVRVRRARPASGRAGSGTGWSKTRRVGCCLLLTLSLAALLVLARWGRQGGLLVPTQDYLDFRQPAGLVSYTDLMEENFSFNLTSRGDVMVFLHIQKTGGTTFGRHLVQDIDLDRPCQCHRRRTHSYKRKLHCDCFRPDGGEDVGDSSWLFSRYSTGWKCGLHPDWTELTGCVGNWLASQEGDIPRRYFYLTFLRSPVERYLSEWRHVRRGATWAGARHGCGGRDWDLPACYTGHNWTGVSLQQFLACPHNLALNRQVRMLADLELVHCYNTTAQTAATRDSLLLHSAMANLQAMAYFGLTEEQQISQYIFEETFNLRFKTDFEQLDKTDTHSGSAKQKISDDIIEHIRTLNSLDEELYKFAKQLLYDRFKSLQDSDDSFEGHMKTIENEKYEFSWSDIEDEDEN